MRLLCTVLLLTLFPIPAVHAQDESLGDIARRERARKQAKQAPPQPVPARATDAEGFTWTRGKDRTAIYEEIGFGPSSTVAGIETHMTAEECEADCLKDPDCKAYKFGPAQHFGKTDYMCWMKRPIPMPSLPSAPVGGVDTEGFTWVRQGSPSGFTTTTGFNGDVGEGTAEGCRSYCERSDCLAYKFGHGEIGGRYTATCKMKGRVPEPNEQEKEQKIDPGMGALMMYVVFVQSAATATLPSELAKLSTTEKRGFGNLLQLVFAEKACRQMSGKFATLNQLETVGCKDASGFGEVELGPMPADVAADLNHGADYTLALDTVGEVPVITMAPKKPGLTGFYYDGTKVHSQAGGPATSTSPSMGTEEEILKAVINAQPKDKP